MVNISMGLFRSTATQSLDGIVFGGSYGWVPYDSEERAESVFNSVWNILYDLYRNGVKGALVVSSDWDGSDSTPLCIAPGVKITLLVNSFDSKELISEVVTILGDLGVDVVLGQLLPRAKGSA